MHSEPDVRAITLSTRLLSEPASAATSISSVASSATPAELTRLILDVLDDAKAEETVSVDLTGKTTIADAMIVTQGRSNRHVAAIAEQVLQRLKDEGHGRGRVEGLAAGDWVLIDAGDVIVHIFRPEVRAFYNLEKMWAQDRPAEKLVV